MGYKQTTISEITGLSKVTVNRYIKDYREDPSFKEKKNLSPGRPSNLDFRETKELVTNIRNNTEDWTVSRLIHCVSEKYGVTYTEQGMRKLLSRILEPHEASKIRRRKSTGW
jgi:transposase